MKQTINRNEGGTPDPVLKGRVYEKMMAERGLSGRELADDMLEVMYDIPSQNQIKEVVITEEVIQGKSEPIRLFDQDKEMKSA